MRRLNLDQLKKGQPGISESAENRAYPVFIAVVEFSQPTAKFLIYESGN